MSEILNEIANLVERGKLDAASKYPRDLMGQPGVKEKVQAALDAGIAARDILNEGLTVGMRALGKKFSSGEVFVPEVLLAAKAMNAGVDILKPLLATGEQDNRGVFIIGTVQGDIHDIGKNLVKMLVEGSGWKVVDLGTNVSPQAFVDAAKSNNAAAIGLSALLTTTMEEMRSTVKALRDAGVTVPVLVGGAPLTDGFANEIGAVYGKDPSAAVEYLDKLAA
jgi:5-methyltetrahydrofolate--homocysteine methyltransferase